MNGDKKYRGKFEYPMGVEPMDDPPQSVESERKIIDSNPIRGTFVHAKTGAESYANIGAAYNKTNVYAWKFFIQIGPNLNMFLSFYASNLKFSPKTDVFMT